MAQLTSIQDQLLTQASSMYVPEGYLSESLFPKIGVVQTTGKLAKYGLSHTRIETSIVGGRGAFRRVEPISRSTTTYTIEAHGLEGLVTDEDYRNVQKPYDAEADETIGLTHQLWNEKEFIFATALSATGTLTQNVTLSGSGQFSDYDNSDPVGVCKTGRLAIVNGCGMKPNVAWGDYSVAETLRYHPQLLDNLGFKDSRPGGLSDAEIAKALGVEKFMVASARYNSAKEGQSDVLAAIWGKHLWFGVLPSSAQVRQVSGGYYVVYSDQAPRKVFKSNVSNPPESTSVIVKDSYDLLLSNVGALYLIKDAIA